MSQLIYAISFIVFVSSAFIAASDGNDLIPSAAKKQEEMSDEVKVLAMVCHLQAMHSMPNKTDETKRKIAEYEKCMQRVADDVELTHVLELASDEIEEKAVESSEFRAYIKEWIKRDNAAEEAGDLDASRELSRELLSSLRLNNISWISELSE